MVWISNTITFPLPIDGSIIPWNMRKYGRNSSLSFCYVDATPHYCERLKLALKVSVSSPCIDTCCIPIEMSLVLFWYHSCFSERIENKDIKATKSKVVVHKTAINKFRYFSCFLKKNLQFVFEAPTGSNSNLSVVYSPLVAIPCTSFLLLIPQRSWAGASCYLARSWLPSIP